MEAQVIEFKQESHYLTAEQWEALTTKWKGLSEAKEITSGDIVLYNLLRSKPIDRGFTEKTTNIQGNDAWFGLKMAKYRARIVVKNSFADRFGFTAPATLLGMIAD